MAFASSSGAQTVQEAGVDTIKLSKGECAVDTQYTG